MKIGNCDKLIHHFRLHSTFANRDRVSVLETLFRSGPQQFAGHLRNANRRRLLHPARIADAGPTDVAFWQRESHGKEDEKQATRTEGRS